MKGPEVAGASGTAAEDVSGTAAEDVYDRRAAAWAAWQDSPWGRLRYRLVANTLDRLLARLGPGCRVLDAGGGDGGDTLPLAARGHLVTILDRSGALLDRARAAAEEAGLAGRVRTVRADVNEPAAWDAAGAGTGFDLILCHNVLQYQDDVPTVVGLLARAARPGGALSLLAPNPAMDVLALAVRRTRPADALAMIDAATVRSETIGHEMRRLDAGTVEAALRSAGCTVTRRFGIRCVTDLIADDGLKEDPRFFAELERLELELCDREPYLRTARFWQLLAVRDG